jgi:DNA-binding NarL/FixJ family response regulator
MSLMPPPAAGESGKTRVYIVDDQTLVRHGLSVLISGEADMHVCGEAEDAERALREIGSARPHIVIVDISLKHTSGLELIRSIRELDAGIAILVLTMHDESMYALRTVSAGARAYVMKHDALSKVLEAIRRLRNGQLYFSAGVTRQMVTSVLNGGKPPAGENVQALTERELELVACIGRGYSTLQMATRLHLSTRTIDSHRADIKRKLNVRTALQLVEFCIGWVEKNSAGDTSPAPARVNGAPGRAIHAQLAPMPAE